jgi:mannose-1-phosphate guanylyltransferase/mannose-1-phosphate guanylyltransferase/mannose-6-phosphate isomerase
MLTAVQHAMDAAEYDGQVICPNSEAFSATPADSIDYAVMEKAERVAVVPVSMGWSDVGSWDALSTLTQADSNGNAISGNVTSIETHNCLIRSDGLRISTIGLAGLTIIASGNDILILPKGRAQDVKKLNL